MIIDLCKESNSRRDYPENSFTIIEHICRGLMDLDVDASINTPATLSQLSYDQEWTEMHNIPFTLL